MRKAERRKSFATNFVSSSSDVGEMPSAGRIYETLKKFRDETLCCYKFQSTVHRLNHRQQQQGTFALRSFETIFFSSFSFARLVSAVKYNETLAYFIVVRPIHGALLR